MTTAASIAMRSANEGWATSVDQSTGESVTTLWRYGQGTWQPMPIHDPQQADIEHFSMLSPDDGWAIGSFPLPLHQGDHYQRQGGAIWHYASGQWQVVQRITDDPAQAITLGAVQATAPGEVWVYETDSVGRRFLHGINGTWRSVDVPKAAVISAIAMVSTDEGWAVGEGGAILHFSGGRWADYFAH